MDYRIVLKYTDNGVEKELKFVNRNIHAVIRYFKRKYPGCLMRDIYTTETWDKHIPPPPEGFEFARFKVKTKKGRWGKIVNVPEMLNES